MKVKMKEVRNQSGILLFKAVQIKEDWYVQVKNHGICTLARLQPDGSLTIKDYDKEMQS